MRLPPISLLALPLSNTHRCHRQGCSTLFLFTQSSGKEFDQAVFDEVAVNALKVDTTSNSPEEPASKQTRSKKRRSNGNGSLTTRQKSIALGNDPITSLNLNLDHLAKSTQPASAIRAEEMLLRIEALFSDGYYEKPPDVTSYNIVINSYAHGRGVDDRLGNGKRLLQRMIERGVQPNEISYNTLLRCLLKEMQEIDGDSIEIRREKVLQAESLIETMEEMQLSNTISYNTVISILSKSCLKDSPQRAEYWLRHMMQLFNSTGDEKVEPDVCSFNSAIHAYSNAISDLKHSKQNCQSYSSYAARAEELLIEMETLCNKGQESVRPDVISYSAVINAYARAASKENEWCADRAIEILEKMEKDASVKKEVERKSVKPNKRTYTAVINALARIGNAEAADKILTKMKRFCSEGKNKKLKPDAICYTSVIGAYAKKGGEDAADRAEELLREMENLYNSGNVDVKPNTRTYCSVIRALGKSGRPRDAEKAEQILDEMEVMSSTYGIKDLAPNTICYNTVIDAYARSTSVSKAYRTELLLERMLEESKQNLLIRPDTITFNSVINTAAQSFYGDEIVKKEAYLIALNAFKTLHSLDHCRPSSVTYSSFLKALQNLVENDDARDHMAKKVFGLCLNMGLVNDSVRLQLRRTCSSQLVAHHILESAVADVNTEQ